MAVTLRAAFGNVQDVRRDLDSVKLGMSREVTAALRDVNPILARATVALTPRGPGPQGGKDTLPHIAETISGGTTAGGITVGTTHPGGPVLEFGGTISPKGHPITFRAHEMAQRAGEAEMPAVEAAVEKRLDALLRAHGL